MSVSWEPGTGASWRRQPRKGGASLDTATHSSQGPGSRAGGRGTRPGPGLCSSNQRLHPGSLPLPPSNPPGSELGLQRSVLLGQTRLGPGERLSPGVPDAHRGCVPGILYGTMTMELGGRVTIECKKNSFRAELEFKLKVALAGAPWPPKGLRGHGAQVGEGEARGRPLPPSRCTKGAVLSLPAVQPGPERDGAANRPHSGTRTGSGPLGERGCLQLPSLPSSPSLPP